MNRFQRPERNLVQEIQDSNIKLSQELLDKSAQKLLQIMRTPNRKQNKNDSEIQEGGLVGKMNVMFNSKLNQQNNRKAMSPYSNKSLVE